MTEIKGTCNPAFETVLEAFNRNFENGDLGASCAIAVDGEMVVDIWGGIADHNSGKLWEKDTIVNVWSTTKTMTALCILVLIDRGEIEIDSPVSKYWKGFSKNGL